MNDKSLTGRYMAPDLITMVFEPEDVLTFSISSETTTVPLEIPSGDAVIDWR